MVGLRSRRLPQATYLFATGTVVLMAMVPGAWWLARTPWVGVDLESDSTGAFVVSIVEPGSSADDHGLRPGDVVDVLGTLRPQDLAVRDPAAAFDLAAKNQISIGRAHA